MARQDGGEYWKYSSLGLEFAGVLVLFAYFGYLADQHWRCEPWGILIGVAVGLIGGMYWLIKETWPVMKGSPPSRGADKEHHDQEPPS